MGNKTGKLHYALQRGQEEDILKLLEDKSLSKKLDPCFQYPEGQTPLHYAAFHGMTIVFRKFIFIMRNKTQDIKLTNSKQETTLHLLCKKGTQDKARCELITMVLDLVREGQRGTYVNAKDDGGSTALHNAGKFGLSECAALLIKHGASVTEVNNLKRTPAEEAEEARFPKLALVLESKAVYGSPSPSPMGKLGTDGQDQEDDLEALDVRLLYDKPEPFFKCLKLQEIRSEKDSLIVQVTDILEVPLYKAEALLGAYEWNKDALVEAWLEDSKTACLKAGVVDMEEAPKTDETKTCGICQDETEGLISLSCGHSFCPDCWKQYLSLKITENQKLTCPGFKCPQPVPQDVVERLVSKDVAEKSLRFDLSAFVSRSKTIKFCPVPRCDLALQKLENTDKKYQMVEFRITGECSKGHFFCFECLDEAHEPCKCDNWKKWKEETIKYKGLAGDGKTDDVAALATSIWLAQNTKKCPKCNVSIQKNEGCNHMTCNKCKHEFCWICMDAWKTHGQQTGGFFSCNKYNGPGPSKAAEETQSAQKREKDTERFVHYFERFGAHDSSRKLEEKFFAGAGERMEALESETKKHLSTQFLEAAFRELLKNRLSLRNSFVYRYYVDDEERDEYKFVDTDLFDKLQSELEQRTEMLSGMIARKRMKDPKTKIIEAALEARKSRVAFLGCAKTQEPVPEPAATTIPKPTKTTRRKGKHHQQQSSTSLQLQHILADTTGRRGSARRQGSGSLNTMMGLEQFLHFHQPPATTPTHATHATTHHTSHHTTHHTTTAASTSWSCPSCTFLNHDSTVCDMCSEPKPITTTTTTTTHHTLPTLPTMATHKPRRHSLSSTHSTSSDVPADTGDTGYDAVPHGIRGLAGGLLDDWHCQRCTYANSGSDTACAVCGAARVDVELGGLESGSGGADDDDIDTSPIAGGGGGSALMSSPKVSSRPATPHPEYHEE